MTTIKNLLENFIWRQEEESRKMMHECNRETCPTTSVTGPKANCLKCKKLCCLLCHGAEKSSTGMIRFKLPIGLTIYVDIATAQFACSTCILEKNVVVQTTMQIVPKVTKEVSVEVVTNTKVLEVLKAGFIDLKDHINANVRKNAQEIVKSVDELTKIVNATTKVAETPVIDSNRPLYSTVIKQKRKALFNDEITAKSTPVSMKRKRRDESGNGGDLERNNRTSQPSLNVPKPRMGRNDAIIGQKPKPWEPRVQKRRSLTNEFSKSLRVAGLHPSVTVEQLSDYIIKNTPLSDASKFDCMMLVKKGQDLNDLTYVSAKIDVLPEDFDGMLNLDLWPNYVTVREFVRVSKPKQRSNERDETQPNKIIRTNKENLPKNSPSTRTTSEAQLGFREGMDTQN